MWVLRAVALVNMTEQTWHLMLAAGPTWTRLCVSSVDFTVNFLPHLSQVNGFSPKGQFARAISGGENAGRRIDITVYLLTSIEDHKTSGLYYKNMTIVNDNWHEWCLYYNCSVGA